MVPWSAGKEHRILQELGLKAWASAKLSQGQGNSERLALWAEPLELSCPSEHEACSAKTLQTRPSLSNPACRGKYVTGDRSNLGTALGVFGLPAADRLRSRRFILMLSLALGFSTEASFMANPEADTCSTKLHLATTHSDPACSAKPPGLKRARQHSSED